MLILDGDPGNSCVFVANWDTNFVSFPSSDGYFPSNYRKLNGAGW